jgi:hypothetical protein
LTDSKLVLSSKRMPLRAGLVFQRQQLRQQLHDRHFGAERPPYARELDPDHAAAEDDDRTGHPVQLQRVVGGDHVRAVDLQPGQAAWYGPGGEHHVLGFVDSVADPDRVRRFEPARTLDGVDLPSRDGGLQTPPQPVDHRVLVLLHARYVNASERGLDAELRALLGLVRDLGRVQQSLGRDAAAMQAGPADLVFFDQRHTLAELGRAQRAGVSATAAPEHDDVVAADALCHPSSLLNRLTQSSSFHLLIAEPS